MGFDSAFKVPTQPQHDTKAKPRQKSEAELILLPQPNTRGPPVGGEGSYIEHTHTNYIYLKFSIQAKDTEGATASAS